VRILAVPLALLAGSGVLIYMAAWILIPREDEPSIAQKEIADRRELRNILGVATVVLALLLGLQALGLHDLGTIAWPLMLGAVGLFVVWRGGSTEERNYLQDLLERAPLLGVAAQQNPRSTVFRALTGIVLVLVGLGGIASVAHPSGAAARGFFGAIAVMVGFLILFGPWWLKMLRELTEERRERVRAEERADMAAHIHDSVLQTLTLIQKSAGNDIEVRRLARAQERELRSWLFGGVRPGSLSGNPSTLSVAVFGIEGEVEDGYGVGVESVVVGDCELDDPTRALLAAGREAIINAAKWSGDTNISVFVEASLTAVSMFVRDRGCGFDQHAIPADRNGIAQSIISRMSRHGGSAAIRSEPGAGTDVKLEMPRKPHHE
jgi:signal transduction histidine kinase